MSKEKVNPRVVIMREAIGKIVGLLTARSIKVTQQGHKAFVEYDRMGYPKRVNIPYLPDNASNDFLDAVQGFIDHEIGHIFFTDYKVLLKAKSLGLGNLHNVLEDTFVERKMKEKFTGSAHNIGKTATFFFKNYTDKKLMEEPSKAVGLLLVPAIRAWSGQREAIEYMTPEKWEVIKPVADKLGDLIKEVPKIKSSQDALELAIKFQKARKDDEEEKPKDPPKKKEATGGKGKTPEDKGEGAPSTEDTGEFADGAMDSGDFRDGAGDRELDDEHRDPDAEREPSDSEDPDMGDGLDFGGEKEEGEAAGKGAGDDDTPFSPDAEDAGFDPRTSEDSEPEGDDDAVFSDEEDEFSEDREAKAPDHDPFKDITDYDDGLAEALSAVSRKVAEKSDYLIWSKDFDKVEEFTPRGSAESFAPMVKHMQDKVDHMVGTIQKDLERAIAARTRSVWRPGLRKGRLNASSLSRLTLGDDRVFRRREVSTSKDVAVGLLVDCSGSMYSEGRIQTASLAAYALTSVLDRMNIANEVLGFTTERNLPREMREDEDKLETRYARVQNIYMPIFKGFSERLTPSVKRRIAAFPSSLELRENVDGECVEIAAQRLLLRDEARKILIVLSDGAPACPGDWHQLSSHLKRTVQMVQRAGVDVVGIGIQTDSVRGYYPKHVVLNNVSELAGTVVKQLRALLLAA